MTPLRLPWQGNRSDGFLACLKSGYFRRLILAVLYFIASAGALLAAALVCVVYILGAVGLWLRGLWGVIALWQWGKPTAEKILPADEEKSAVMPGAWGVNGDVWKAAEGVVKVSYGGFLDCNLVIWGKGVRSCRVRPKSCGRGY